jgi:CRP-like cAMP-binding protein
MLSTMERVLFLRSVDVFGAITGEDLAPVAIVAEEVAFRTGETIIGQGEPGEGLYVIVDGEVAVVIQGAGQVAVRGPGSVIGEMAVLSGGPRTATCVAVSEVLALQVRRDDFLELLVERPALALGVIGVLTQRLDEATRRLAEAQGS